jgi:hypothetical protein
MAAEDVAGHLIGYPDHDADECEGGDEWIFRNNVPLSKNEWVAVAASK